MMKLTNVLALVALAFAAAATAQNLDKAQEGRAAVGDCYSQCLAEAKRDAWVLWERVDRLTDMLISDEFFALTDQSQDELRAGERRKICVASQIYMAGLDGCYAGCLDIEIAYGVRASTARNRFIHLLRTERQPLLDAGLWRDYRTRVEGAELDAACERWWASLAEGNDERSQLAAVRRSVAEQREAALSRATGTDQ